VSNDSHDAKPPSFNRKLAVDALKALKETEPDWRYKWWAVLSALSADAALVTDDGKELPFPDGDEIADIFSLLAMMFLDNQMGARNPLSAPRVVNHRPRNNSEQILKSAWLIALTGCELAVGKLSGRSPEESYRAAASRIRRANGSIGWKELRSAWSNRNRGLGIDGATKAIEWARDAGFPELKLNDYACIAARHLNQKPPS